MPTTLLSLQHAGQQGKHFGTCSSKPIRMQYQQWWRSFDGFSFQLCLYAEEEWIAAKLKEILPTSHLAQPENCVWICISEKGNVFLGTGVWRAGKLPGTLLIYFCCVSQILPTGTKRGNCAMHWACAVSSVKETRCCWQYNQLQESVRHRVPSAQQGQLLYLLV